MNIFYAPSEQIAGHSIELLGQEARHAGQVLRYRKGDSITVVDGRGGWYEGTVQTILKDTVQISIDRHFLKKTPQPELVLGLGIIKKRDRLEFAVEKAVELGVSEIALFRSRYTVKEKIRRDRLEKTMLSAMKQSLRSYLPEVEMFDSVYSVVETYDDCKVLIAHQAGGNETGIPDETKREDKLLLLVGPEGGFSPEEIQNLSERGAELVTLGDHRLRAETASLALLSQFL